MDNTKLAKIYSHIEKELPVYARPLFLRVIKEMPLTVTYKQKKVEAVKEGFDPTVVKDPLFFINQKQKTYIPLTIDNMDGVLQSRLWEVIKPFHPYKLLYFNRKQWLEESIVGLGTQWWRV